MFASFASFPVLRNDVRVRRFKRPLSVVVNCVMESNKVEKAVVRIPEGEENLTITLNIDDRTRTLNRPKREALSRSLHRLRLSLFSNKKSARKGTPIREAENGVDGAVVALYESEGETKLIDVEMLNEEAWSKGRWLVAGERKYHVLANPPTVTKLALNEIPIEGHPTLPECTLEFASETESRWKWFTRRTKAGMWKERPADAQLYVPTADDVGCHLRVECTPVLRSVDAAGPVVRTGDVASAEIGPIFSANDRAAGDGRHHLTRDVLSSPLFRMVTYNVLADSYVSRPNAKSIFAYCSPRDLHIDMRKQLVLKELLGYNADIICLQECDKKVFEKYYAPHLQLHDFHGIFTQKSGTTKEGEAVFVRKSRFEVVDSVCMHMNQVLEQELPPYLLPFKEMISVSKNMRDALKALVTVGQIVLLKPRDAVDKALCVINTHLISHSCGEHIRVLHVLTMLHGAKQWIAQKGLDAQICLVGDLNTSVDHETGATDALLTLLRDGRLPKDHWEWRECRKFTWTKMTGDDDVSKLYKGSEEKDHDPIEGIDLELPFNLESAMSLATAYTNFVEKFRGLLDYVWYEPTYLDCERTLPIPTPEEIGKPCPSAVYPSDHLAVVVDMKFVGRSSGAEALGEVLAAELSNVDRATAELAKGSIVGVPTDTIYGLAGDATSTDAVSALYALKGRSLDVPLAVCVSSPSEVAAICEVDHLPDGVLESLLPGPVTVVLKRKGRSALSPDLNPGLPTIGVRVPDSDFILQLGARFGRPLALTSANRSGESSSVDISEFQDLWKDCAVVFDGGEISRSRRGSTVVDLSTPGVFRVLRKGDGLKSVLDAMEHFGIQQTQC